MIALIYELAVHSAVLSALLGVIKCPWHLGREKVDI